MVVICDISGLRVHRRFGSRLSQSRLTSLAASKASVSHTENIDVAAFVRELGDLHVLVDSQAKKSASKHVIPHVCTKGLSQGSLLQLKRGVYVASIGICLIQMSRRLSIPELIRVCYELCAMYEVVPDTNEVNRQDTENLFDHCRQQKCPPLVSVVELRKSVSKNLHLKGAKRVLDVLRFVVDGSESPRETDLAMYTWCPMRIGGYGFRVAAMNKTVLINGSERRCDLFFSQERVGVEYDSDLHHNGPKKSAEDSARVKQFEGKGYRMVSITNGELKDFDLAHEAMTLLGKHLGIRVRRVTGINDLHRHQLHEFINTPHQPFLYK